MPINPELGISTAIFMLSQTDPTVLWMSVAGVISFLIGIMAARSEIARAKGLDKLGALANVCFAAPLAVFGAEHFGDARSIMQAVPKYMPAPLFWTYFVGVALIAASLSIATRI